MTDPTSQPEQPTERSPYERPLERQSDPLSLTAPEPVPQQPSLDQQPRPSGPPPTQQADPALMADPGTYPPPTPSKRRATGPLIALLAVFVLATGAFAILWLVERGDHKQTTSQLTGALARIDAAQQEIRRADAKTSLVASDRAKLQDQLDEASAKIAILTKDATSCDKAGRAYVKAAFSNDQKNKDDAMNDIWQFCYR
jgi:hypothetical protein